MSDRSSSPLLSFLFSLRWLFVLVGVTLLCLELEENYPFSHFPMYQKFSSEPFYVFVSDKDGNPIAVQVETLHRTGRLKKLYEKNGLLKKAKAEGTTNRELSAEKKEPLARPVLEWLWENTRPEERVKLEAKLPLRLEEVWIDLDENGEIQESEPEVIASFSPEEPSSP